MKFVHQEFAPFAQKGFTCKAKNAKSVQKVASRVQTAPTVTNASMVTLQTEHAWKTTKKKVQKSL